MFKENDRVRVADTGETGYVEAVSDGLVTVRIPRADGWPFPSYVKCARKSVKKIPKQVPVYEPAPF